MGEPISVEMSWAIGSISAFKASDTFVSTAALSAGPMNQLRSTLQTLSGAGTTAGASKESARKLQAEVVARMKSILEQMSQWESFVDVVNQVAEVIKMEQKVVKDTEKARESRTEEIFDDKP